MSSPPSSSSRFDGSSDAKIGLEGLTKRKYSLNPAQQKKWLELKAARQAAKAKVTTTTSSGNDSVNKPSVPFFGFGPEGPRFTPPNFRADTLTMRCLDVITTNLRYPGMLSAVIRYLPTEFRDEILRKALLMRGRREKNTVDADEKTIHLFERQATTTKNSLLPMLILREVLSFVHPELAHLDLSPYGEEVDDESMSEVVPHIRSEAISDLKHRLSFIDDDEDEDEEEEEEKEEEEEEEKESTWEDIDDFKIRESIAGAGKLMHLNLAGCTRLSQHFVQSMLSQFPKLRSLSLRGCHQLHYLKFAMPSLRFLDLSYNDTTPYLRRRDAAVKPSSSPPYFSAGNGNGPFLFASDDSDLTSTPSFSQSSGVSQEPYFFSFSSMTTVHLTHLSLAFSLVQMTPEGLFEARHCLSEIAKCKRLEWLDLSGCTAIDTSLLFDVLKDLPILQTLLLRQCTQFNMAGTGRRSLLEVFEFTGVFYRLVVLDITGCSQELITAAKNQWRNARSTQTFPEVTCALLPQ